MPDKVVPPGEGLAARVTSEPDSQVDVLRVLLRLVFAVEALAAVLALERPVVGVNRLSVTFQLLGGGEPLPAGLAAAWLLVGVVRQLLPTAAAALFICSECTS